MHGWQSVADHWRFFVIFGGIIAVLVVWFSYIYRNIGAAQSGPDAPPMSDFPPDQLVEELHRAIDEEFGSTAEREHTSRNGGKRNVA